ncbi:hypothetical protein ACJU26_08810 [Acidithiobacillus sp. M4-SHS-6]|uniref:hypothetical protein n=1 Tax=Acidithiobacillus sp. M4-SHS-6 TaxID=3383024 RepID=UPI0039BECB30
MTYLRLIIWLLLMGWLMWNIHILDFDRLRALFLREAPAPDNYPERWAMEWYRATFAPDCGIPGLSRMLSWLGWTSWLSLLTWAGLETLSVVGGVSNVWWDVGAMGVVVISTTLLLILLGIEALLRHLKRVPRDVRVRREQWLQAHPVPQGFQSPAAGELPIWFWLDSDISRGWMQVLFFFGSFVITLLAVFCGYHVMNPELVSWSKIWGAFFCWVLVCMWFPVILSVWLSHLDWTYRPREIILTWAAIQVNRI